MGGDEAGVEEEATQRDEEEAAPGLKQPHAREGGPLQVL